MDIAALIAWVITAFGGIYLLVTWLVHDGMRQRKSRATNFSATLILGHFAFAATGLVTWTAYVLTDIGALAWVALADLLCVALLGFTMFVRWGGEPKDAGTLALPGPGGEAGPGAHGSGQHGLAQGPAGAGPRGPVADLSTRRWAGFAAPAGHTPAPAAMTRTRSQRPAESHFPAGIVAAHGGFAVSTVILVLLAALGVGG